MAFQEKDLEKLIDELISAKGYEYVPGDDLNRQIDDVILRDDLRQFLRVRYADKGITNNEIDGVIRSLTGISINPLYDANKQAFKKIVYGETLVREDRLQKDFWCQLIDFEHPENNIYKVSNQVVIKGPVNKRIPDTIIFINGLPMIVWEFKSAIKEETTIHDAYTQITTRYTRDIPELFKYNAFVVISDGVNSKMGSLFAEYEHFYAWRKVNEDDDIVDGVASLYTMIDGLFTHERLLDVIQNFIFFPDDNTKRNIKIVCNYPQYFAATKLKKNVLVHRKPIGDGKGGTYFGTTGCGKSYGMLFLTRLLMRDAELRSPTVVLITDRTDLDDQLSNSFTVAKDFIGDKEVLSILSREDLKDKLQGKTAGGVYLTTIQKFTEDISLLSDRYNIICIADEAHRTQTNLDQKTVITKDGVRTTYGYAKYLRDSLPNATYIGFSGTPIDETEEVFGKIVEKYTMRHSIADEITVNLTYDGRLVKTVLDAAELNKIEEYYTNALKDGANEYQVEESKKKSVSIQSIMEDEKVLRKVAECFVEHYEGRVEEGSTVKGKALFVAPSRPAGWKLYNILKEIRPEWFIERQAPDGVELSEEELNKLKPMPMVKMIMTRAKDDPKEFYDLLGNDDDRRDWAIQFKDDNSNFKIAIIVDMWLTGFDVPSLDTMYIDKLIVQRHTIIQAISRVNRAYPGKESGLIVDFAGIKLGIDLALKKYTDYTDDGIEDIEKAIKIVKDELDVLDNMFYKKFDSSKYFTGNEKERLDCLQNAVEFIQKTKDLENRFMAVARRMKKAFNLCQGVRDFTKDELDRIHYYCAIRSYIFKLNKGTAPDIHTMNKKVQEMVHNALSANDAEELFSLSKGVQTSVIDLTSPEYLDRLNKIEQPNTKVKILEQLLRNLITEFKKTNKIKAVSFSQRLKSIIDRYNDRTLDWEEANRILDSTAKQLMELVKELAEEKNSFEKLGISYEVKAFYDVLVDVEKKYEFDFPDDKNMELAKKIFDLVQEKEKYSGWLDRTDARAELQMDIMRLLFTNGFPPLPEGTMEDYEKVYNDVIDQTENFKKYYNA